MNARSRTCRLRAFLAAVCMAAGPACFLAPDRADLTLGVDQLAYARDGESAIVVTMRNDGSVAAVLSGTDHIRIDIEHFHDGRWWFESCLGCYARQPPVEETLELSPGETHIDTVAVGTWWRLGQYRLAVPYRSADKRRESRWAYSGRFEVS